MASLVMPMFAPDAQRSQRDSNTTSHNTQRNSSRSSNSPPPSSAQIPSRPTSSATPSRHHTPQSNRQSSSSQSQVPDRPPSPRLEAAQDAQTIQPPEQACDPAPTDSTAVELSLTDRHNSVDGSIIGSPMTIEVRDLQHIQSLVDDETNPIGQPRQDRRLFHQEHYNSAPQYCISQMPIADVIEMVAGLLTRITTTNDRQHEHLHRQMPPPDGGGSLSQETASVLAFHGKTVPSITILSYLTRVHKYCPTTHEVFISLLVYFDRMAETVNSGRLRGMKRASELSLDTLAAVAEASVQNAQGRRFSAGNTTSTITPPMRGNPATLERQLSSSRRDLPSPPLSDSDFDLTHFFVVDSFNIHRLIIATVTCASKFFSDIFYTNSRYAKVCLS